MYVYTEKKRSSKTKISLFFQLICVNWLLSMKGEVFPDIYLVLIEEENERKRKL